MTRSTYSSQESFNFNLISNIDNLKDVRLRKIVGKILYVTSNPETFKKLLELQENKNESLTIMYTPRNFETDFISNIHYVMQGPYPNIDNVSYLGLLAKTYIGNLDISSRLNLLDTAELLYKETHIRFLTGHSNINLKKGNYPTFKNIVMSNKESNVLAFSRKSTGLFEMNRITIEEIMSNINYVKAPLIIF